MKGNSYHWRKLHSLHLSSFSGIFLILDFKYIWAILRMRNLVPRCNAHKKFLRIYVWLYFCVLTYCLFYRSLLSLVMNSKKQLVLIPGAIATNLQRHIDSETLKN